MPLTADTATEKTTPDAGDLLWLLDETDGLWRILAWANLVAAVLANPEITGAIKEEVHALSGTTPALDPANGSIQTWTLSANSTPTDSLAAGQSITLMIDDGSAYTITWPTMQWIGGSAPTLATSGYSVVELWKVGSTLYGAYVGDLS